MAINPGILKALIIDDEKDSHLVLHRLLKNHQQQIGVLASGYCIADGYRLLQEYQPDLIFLDIEMPDGLGFDLLKKIEEPDFDIIFITAHNKYAVTAIKFGALDYLLKPIKRKELKEAIERVIKRREKERVSKEQILTALEAFQRFQSRTLPTRIGISTAEGILYKKVEEIIRLEAKQNYTEFSLSSDTKKVLASGNLKEYEKQFEYYPEFMRVHRSHLVNLKFVDKYVKSEGGYLVMQDGAEVNVSNQNKEELLDRMEDL